MYLNEKKKKWGKKSLWQQRKRSKVKVEFVRDPKRLSIVTGTRKELVAERGGFAKVQGQLHERQQGQQIVEASDR